MQADLVPVTSGHRPGVQVQQAAGAGSCGEDG